MIIKRIFNNNVVLAERSNGTEVVLIGRGLAYGSNKGELVDKSKINKVFEMKDEIQEKFTSIVQDIPYDCILTTELVIQMIRGKSSKTISDRIYVTLMEHIANLIERINMGISFDSLVLLNIKNLYKEEYSIALEATQLIRERLKLKIEDEEANFIALHIINAQMDSDMMEIYRVTSIIDNIVDIVISQFEIDRNSTNYDRFLLHCRFFAQRIANIPQKEKEIKENRKIYEMLAKEHMEENNCVLKLKNLIKEKYDYIVNIEETLYLLIHLINLTH